MRSLPDSVSRYVLADGRQLSHIMGTVWELLTPLGEHVDFVYEIGVDYGIDTKAQQTRFNGTVPR